MKIKSQKSKQYIIKTLLISIIIALLVFLINALIYRYVTITLPKDFIYFAAAFATAAATVYAVITGFTILIAFTRYQNLNNIVQQEISCLGDILDFTKYIEAQETVKDQIIKNVKEYGSSVANHEWPNMIKGQPHPVTSNYLEKIMDSINQISSTTKNAIIFELFVNRIKDLTTFRANRLSEASEPFPRLLMLTMYVISVIFILSVFTLFTPEFLFQSVFLISATFVVSLIIHLINDIGNPYKPGIWHISKEIYENIQTSILTQIKKAQE